MGRRRGRDGTAMYEDQYGEVGTGDRGGGFENGSSGRGAGRGGGGGGGGTAGGGRKGIGSLQVNRVLPAFLQKHADLLGRDQSGGMLDDVIARAGGVHRNADDGGMTPIPDDARAKEEAMDGGTERDNNNNDVVDDDVSERWLNEARMLSASGRWKEAAEACDRGLAEEPRAAIDARAGMAGVLLEERDRALRLEASAVAGGKHSFTGSGAVKRKADTDTDDKEAAGGKDNDTEEQQHTKRKKKKKKKKPTGPLSFNDDNDGEGDNNSDG